MSGTAAQQLEKLIVDIETDLGIDANTPVGAQAAEQKPQAQKKEKKPKAPKPAAAAKPKAAATPAEDQAEITKLDIRVGQIVKVWKHDTADKCVFPVCSVARWLLLCGVVRKMRLMG